MRRLFVTGCPRSGTTLLQSILAHEAGLYTLKETHFFKHLMRRRPLRWIDRHIAPDRSRLLASFDFIAEHNRLAVPKNLHKIRSLTLACRAFYELLDEAARSRSFAGWLEKTPEHMFFLSDIRRHIPEARFVHILRDGPDVIASLVDAKRKYPESWGWIGTLGQTVRLYNRYVRVIAEENAKSDAFILRYDDIINRNMKVLRHLAAFLALDKEVVDPDRVETGRRDIIRSDEPWKVRKDSGIVDTRGQKFNHLFDEQEQAFISRNILSTGGILSG